MDQIKNHFTSIEQMTSQLLQPKASKAEPREQGPSFEEVLHSKKEQSVSELKFSKHANERIQNRNIDLSTEQVKRLESGVAKALEKGISESLVMVDNYAFIVNTRNNVVVTAVTGNEDRVFTNIDGAVIS
ncbi:MAG: flagellar protein [Lachnospiraceae bacterium]|nr:flagellar protein [Lachnospiraceae bacterium]